MTPMTNPTEFWKSFDANRDNALFFVYGDGKLLKKYADFLTRNGIEVAGVLLSGNQCCANLFGYNVFYPDELDTQISYLLCLDPPHFELEKTTVLFNPSLRMSFLVSPLRKKQFGTRHISIISNNCSAGVIYGLLGTEYTSPTVGTAFEYDDFIKLSADPQLYFSCEPVFSHYEENHMGLRYPVGKINDISVRFVHYQSWSEAVEKWHRRSERVNYDDLFFLIDEVIDAITPAKEELFLSINKGKRLIIHHKNYYGNKCTFFTSEDFFMNRQLIDSWFDIIEELK